MTGRFIISRIIGGMIFAALFIAINEEATQDLLTFLILSFGFSILYTFIEFIVKRIRNKKRI